MTLQHDYNQAAAWVVALTGDVDTVMEFRGLHDTNKGVPGANRRGKLADVWNDLCSLNAAGYGIFCMVSATDGIGRELQNITAHRAHFVELDTDAAAMLDKVSRWYYAPHLIVESSAGKYHGYLMLKPYGPDPDRFRAFQHKLVAEFGSDPQAVDAARVLRVPGFFNHKYPDRAPHFVHCWTGPAWGKDRYEIGALEVALAHVRFAAGAGSGGRKPLGDPGLAAPSREWVVRALEQIDPNTLGRADWFKLLCATKQSGIGAGMSEPEVRAVFDQWCARYSRNDLAENEKQWRSVTSTEAGWPMLLKASGLQGAAMFGNGPVAPAVPGVASGVGAGNGGSLPHVTSQPAPITGVTPDQLGTFLDEREQAVYFAGCYLIEREGKIRTPQGRYMDASKFNAKYGGKQFKVKEDGQGSWSDEPWKAATRGQLYRIPKVDHVRFLPNEQPGALIEDELGRLGLNTYKPANIAMMAGDPGPFLRHLRAILKTETDMHILLNYLARCVQSPGVKIPWAPVIQGAEGLGKNVIKFAMSHAIGRVYRYFPKATELAETGGKFNGWMRERLLIICDEVKTDDKRNLIEALKDLVSEAEVQIQSKGVDQEVEDNPANWLFFTNWKSAIPIERNSRRWCIFYSTMQTADDLLAAGMNAQYFASLYNWLKGDGKKIVAHYLMNYPIQAEFDPAIQQRAPVTSSTQEALVASRTGPEHVFYEAIETERAGFRGGWVSTKAFAMAIKAAGLSPVLPASMARILENMGYARIGRAPGAIIQEEGATPMLYSRLSGVNVADYGPAQGYGASVPPPPAR